MDEQTEFLKENDFIFSRSPGRQRQYYTTTDEPNYPWIHRKMKDSRSYKLKRDSSPVDWSNHQDYEVRANAGARILEPGVDPDYRHYIIVGDEPVELVDMLKPVKLGSKAHKGTSSVSLSRKKSYGGGLVK